MKSRIAALDLTTGSPICRQRPRQYHNAVGQLNALRGGCRWWTISRRRGRGWDGAGADSLVGVGEASAASYMQR